MSNCRVLILGAHPDDAEFHAGGLITAHRRAGNVVKIVSVTNGAAGHHERLPAELIRLRRDEAAAVRQLTGVEYDVWEYPDGELVGTLNLRRRIIGEIRRFCPDLVLTHRTCDYHPDHRAVGQAVQDASFMVTVPHIVPEAPALRRDPVVAYLCDFFTKPVPFEPHVVRDCGPAMESTVAMLACHACQVFEWLPYNQGILTQVPAGDAERLSWLKGWYEQRPAAVADRFRTSLVAHYGEPRGQSIQFAEAFEISEYAAPLAPQDRQRLFPELLG